VKATAAFEIEAAAGASPQFDGIAAPIGEATTISVSGVARGERVRFTVDGQAVATLPDGQSLRIDPAAFDPAKPHSLVAAFDSGPPLAGTFSVKALAPQILSPTELPGLRPGDLVRITVVSQPGAATTVTASIDGAPVATLNQPPFSFTVPPQGIAAGDHTVEIRASGAAGPAVRSFTLAVPKPAASSSALAYGVIAVCAAAGLAAALGGAWLLAGWARRRDGDSARRVPMPGWPGRRSGAASAEAAPEPVAEAGPWGAIEVLSGPAAGARFDLRAERELLGSGKFCSIRVGDPSLAPAHAVLSRDGVAVPSTPACALSAGDQAAGAVALRPGTEFRAGSVLLRFEGVAPKREEPHSALRSDIT
jgi:hypothetical protein